MKKIFLMAMIFSSFLYSTVHEDGEDGSVNRWIASTGATVSNVTEEGSNKVIKLSSNSMYRYYRMDDLVTNSDIKIEWDIKSSNAFITYVNIATTDGDRTLYYTTVNRDYGVTSSGIHHGLGESILNGEWHTITRDLEVELQESEPNNHVIAIKSFKIRAIGDVLVDNIRSFSAIPPISKTCSVIEDAEDDTLDRWIKVVGSTVSNTVDDDTGSNVIQLNSNVYKYYRMDYLNHLAKEIKWDIKSSNAFITYVNIATTDGDRTLYYTTVNRDYGVTSSGIHHGLGESILNGEWHTITRDLEAELQESEPNNHVIAIKSFKIRAIGDVFLDNIKGCNGTSFGDNIPPVANAGDEQNVTIGTILTLDGIESTDSDGSIVSYLWKEGTTTLSTDITFSKNNFTIGTHVITLTVTDNDGATDTESVTIIVNSILDTTPPTITLIGNAEVNVTKDSTYIDAGATANDNVDGNITSAIKVTSIVDPTIIGSYTVTYDVNDSSGNQAVQVSRKVNVLDITIPNQAPTANTGDDQNITEGEDAIFDAKDSNDSDGTIISYKWTEGATLLSTESSFTKNDFSVGVHAITLRVTDNDGATATDTLVVTVNEQKNKNISIIFINNGASSFATNQSDVKLEGYASSNIGIKNITCTNKMTTQEFLAQGIQQWNTTVSLVEGDNKIECVALANNNVTSNKVDVTIVYYQNSSLTSLLNFSEDTFFTDETKSITAQIGIDYDTASNIVVKLYEVDDNDNIKPATNYELYDNGVLPDEIDKDEIFTVNFTLNEQSVSSRCYKVGVTEEGESEYFSEKECVNMVKHITQEEMQEFMSINDDIEQIYTDNSDLKVAAQKVYDELVNDARIGAVGINEDGESVWYVSASGIAGGYSKFENNTLGGVRNLVTENNNKIYPRVDEINFIQNSILKDEDTYLKKSNLKMKIQKKSPISDEVSSKKALGIYPFTNNPNGSSVGGLYKAWNDIKNKKSCQLYATSQKANNGTVSITIDDFKNLDAYGYIHIGTHGDNYYRGLFNLWNEEWGTDNWLKGALSQVVLYTGIKITKNSSGNYIYGSYEKDIKTHRIVLNGGFIAITPAFIKRYVKKLPNSIVILEACRSGYNSSMANAFLSKGAKSVVGYTNYVYVSYAENTTGEFIKQLLTGKNTAEAFNNTIAIHGKYDSHPHPKEAYFRLFGSQTLKLASSGLKNTDFEDATLTPWTKVGDGRIITGLGTTAPTDGTYMGIISTGLGYTTTAGSIEQTACLNGGDTTLKFDWNFFSEEFKEYCGSIYQDTFKVTMCEFNSTNNSTSNCTVLFEKKVDDLCAQVSKVTNNFDQGDVYATGWQTANADISSYAGKSISLKFYSTDVGDSAYDSAILLDKIEIK